MTPRTVLTAALLLFVLGSLAFLVAKEVRRNRAAAPAPPTSREAGHRTIVYFLYFLPRCIPCNTVEAYAREAVQTGFADDIRAGRLEWRIADYDEPANRHFVQEFGLITKSVVVVESRNGRTVRWKNLESVWDLLDEKDAFLEYVRAEVRAFMKGASS